MKVGSNYVEVKTRLTDSVTIVFRPHKGEKYL